MVFNPPFPLPEREGFSVAAFLCRISAGRLGQYRATFLWPNWQQESSAEVSLSVHQSLSLGDKEGLLITYLVVVLFRPLSGCL